MRFLCQCGSTEYVEEVIITMHGDMLVVICCDCGRIYDRDFFSPTKINKSNSSKKEGK